MPATWIVHLNWAPWPISPKLRYVLSFAVRSAQCWRESNFALQFSDESIERYFLSKKAFASFFSCGRLTPTRSGVHGCPLGGVEQPVSLARTDLIVLQILADEFHRNLAKTLVRIELGIVADRIKVSQIVANGCESVFLILPVLCKVSLAAGRLCHVLKYRA